MNITFNVVFSEQVTKSTSHHQRAKFSLKRFFKLKSTTQATGHKDDIRFWF